jgi:hypothetical protein
MLPFRPSVRAFMQSTGRSSRWAGPSMSPIATPVGGGAGTTRRTSRRRPPSASCTKPAQAGSPKQAGSGRWTPGAIAFERPVPHWQLTFHPGPGARPVASAVSATAPTLRPSSAAGSRRVVPTLKVSYRPVTLAPQHLGRSVDARVSWHAPCKIPSCLRLHLSAAQRGKDGVSGDLGFQHHLEDLLAGTTYLVLPSDLGSLSE